MEHALLGPEIAVSACRRLARLTPNFCDAVVRCDYMIKYVMAVMGVVIGVIVIVIISTTLTNYFVIVILIIILLGLGWTHPALAARCQPLKAEESHGGVLWSLCHC